FGAVTSQVATLTVQSSTPLITQQPEDRSVFVGSTATFSVTAVGSLPLTYQWRRDGADLPGATNQSLVLTNVTLSDAGQYVVVVHNPRGMTESVTVSLSVEEAHGRVGYFTDFNPDSRGPEAPILRAGFTPVFIQDISAFNLFEVDLLMINESDNGSLSPELFQRLPDIESWVRSRGKLVVHDRRVGPEGTNNPPAPNPFLLGATNTLALRTFQFDSDVDIIPPGTTTVTQGPFGELTNSSLDGGDSSNHGYVLGETLPGNA